MGARSALAVLPQQALLRPATEWCSCTQLSGQAPPARPALACVSPQHRALGVLAAAPHLPGQALAGSTLIARLDACVHMGPCCTLLSCTEPLGLPHGFRACSACSKGPHLQQTQGVLGHLCWIQALLLQPQSALLQLLQGQPCSLQQRACDVPVPTVLTVGPCTVQAAHDRYALCTGCASPADRQDNMPCSAEAM